MRRESELEGGPDKVRLMQFAKSFYLGGTETQVVELLRGLPRNYETQVSVIYNTGPLLEQVWQMGHIPRAFPLEGSFVSPNGAWQIAKLAAHLKKSRVQLVHAQDFYSTLICVPAARLAGCKVIVSRLDLAHWYGKARHGVLAGLTRLADHTIANAEAVKQFLIDKERLPSSRITVIRNGLDVNDFDARRRKGLEAPLPEVGGGKVAVHVANQSHPVKRQEDLLAALSILRREGHDLHVFFVGDGGRRPMLQAQAKSLGIEKYAHFLGHRTDVPAIYAKAHLGVLCSNAEGLSNAVMEGMASKLPMVVTDVGGNPELVQDGVRGFVVPKEQPKELARAIGRVLADERTAVAMGDAGRRFIETELTRRSMVERHDRLYRQVLGLSPKTVH